MTRMPDAEGRPDRPYSAFAPGLARKRSRHRQSPHAAATTQIIANLNDVQLRNRLEPSESLDLRRLHRRDGDRHRQDVCLSAHHLRAEQAVWLHQVRDRRPSVAIKEGVYKTLQITEEHFSSLFANIRSTFSCTIPASSARCGNFATSPHIQVMVVTVGAINKKDVNNLYKDSEKTGGEKPIDLIRATRPIVIVDEPQSVDGGLTGRGKEALGMMNPLCTLRYSATHADKHHMVFRLDAVDAYERKLVKQIEVASAEVEGDHNKALRAIAVGKQRQRADHGPGRA